MSLTSSVAHAVVCIGDNPQWLDGITTRALAAGAPAPTWLSWGQFESAPMTFADPVCVAYAYLDKETDSLDIHLGALCRCFPHGVLLQLAADVKAKDQQFFAHGFQKIGAFGEIMTASGDEDVFLDTAERCFQYRLEHYKAVPDWLNARFWAHPERFHL